ncbi:MAG: MFS transporter [Geminicoccaceae bacterium]
MINPNTVVRDSRPEQGQPAIAGPAPPGADHGDPRRWWILAAMALPAFLLNIDFYGISVALPAIGEAFAAGTTALQWTVNGFNLALVAPLIAFGRLGDAVGRRRSLLAGIVLFALGSAVCGLAADITVLVAGRCLQGLAVALFSTSPLSIVTQAFPPARHGLAFGIWGAIGGLGSALGPLLGGALTELLGWRWFFLANVPVAALTVLLILALVPESRDGSAPGRGEGLGFLAITLGLGGLVFGLQFGDDWGWASPAVLAPTLLGLGLLAGFVRRDARQPVPLLDPALLRRRSYLAVLAVTLTGNFGFAALLFFATLYLQDLLQLGPLAAGLVLAAFSAAFVVTLPLAGAALATQGARRLLAWGMGLMVLAFVLVLGAGEAGLAWMVAALAVAGLGQGLAFNTTTTAAMDAVPAARAGTASGLLNAARQLGSTLGIAVTGAVFQAIESRGLLGSLRPHAVLSPEQEDLVRGLLSGSAAARSTLAELAPPLAGRVDAVVQTVFTTALAGGMLLCALVSLLGLAAAYACPRRPKP